MSDQHWQRIEKLFHEAADLAPFERAEFLSRVCSDDTELRRQVESLLANDKSKDDVLEAAVAKAVDQLPNALFSGDKNAIARTRINSICRAVSTEGQCPQC